MRCHGGDLAGSGERGTCLLTAARAAVLLSPLVVRAFGAEPCTSRIFAGRSLAKIHRRSQGPSRRDPFRPSVSCTLTRHLVLGVLRRAPARRRAVPAQSPARARAVRDQVRPEHLERCSSPEPPLYGLRAAWGGFAASGVVRCDCRREAVPGPSVNAPSSSFRPSFQKRKPPIHSIALGSDDPRAVTRISRSSAAQLSAPVQSSTAAVSSGPAKAAWNILS
jgi:hypothetical protein